jgi:hypothetical protein
VLLNAQSDLVLPALQLARLFVVFVLRNTPTGLLLGAKNGLFRYDGTRTVRVEGDGINFIVRSLDLNPRLQTGRGFSRFLFIG